MNGVGPKGVFLASASGIESEKQLRGDALASRRLFKTLSLLVAYRTGIPIPPSLLILDRSDAVAGMLNCWGFPVMMRVDYSSLPEAKPLGGIPLHSLLSVDAVTSHLLDSGICPLIHPHIDRFTDLYSVGVLLEKASPRIQIEVVGEGFDAGDLRRGVANPHESITFDLHEDSVLARRHIARTEYESERDGRARRAAALRCYTEYANQHGRLKSSLEEFVTSRSDIKRAKESIPDAYRPLSKAKIKTLVQLSWKVWHEVLLALPHSDVYVASFSLVPGHGWLLWDVYGSWYRR